MTNPFNSQQKFNELIFENKNKAYGAYELRKSQGDTVAKSLLITFGAVSLLVLTAFTMNRKSMESKASLIDIDSIRIITIVMDPPPETILPVIEQPAPPVEKSPYSDNLNLKAEDKPVIDPPKAVEAMVFNSKGDKKGEVDSTRHEPVIPVEPVVLPPVTPEPPLDYADEMPELKNLYQFISDHLRFPAMAKDNGTSGTVYLSFVVEKDGSVSNVTTLRGIGDGCEEEAMRVVKMLPKWKPAKNHGQPVRVKFTLPVRFKLQ